MENGEDTDGVAAQEADTRDKSALILDHDLNLEEADALAEVGEVREKDLLNVNARLNVGRPVLEKIRVDEGREREVAHRRVLVHLDGHRGAADEDGGGRLRHSLVEGEGIPTGTSHLDASKPQFFLA